MDKNLMSEGKHLPLDRHVVEAMDALSAARYALGRDPEHPATYIYDVARAVERCEHALAAVCKLLAESEEERARAADVPEEGNVFDLLCWAEAGQQRAQWWLCAYREIANYAEMLQPETPVEERLLTPAETIKALEALREEAANTEGYEAVTALQRAITCLQALNNPGKPEDGG